MKSASALECSSKDRIKQEVEQLAPHEETREKLRRRIIAAARDLLSETASIEFSMRALAAKAEVGHVTPYNIFGSKQAVLLAVLDADIAEFERALQARKNRILSPRYSKSCVCASSSGSRSRSSTKPYIGASGYQRSAPDVCNAAPRGLLATTDAIHDSSRTSPGLRCRRAAGNEPSPNNIADH